MKSAFQTMSRGRKFPLVREFFQMAKFEKKDWIIDSEVAMANLTGTMKIKVSDSELLALEIRRTNA